MESTRSEKSRRLPLPAKEAGLLLALFLAALLARCIGLTWGLPNADRWYTYHPDELQILASVASLDFFNGDFNPDFFNYPSLYIYLSYLAHVFASGIGLARPLSNDPTQSWMFAHDVLLSARFVTAVLGAATAPLVFLIARHFGGVKVGVLAALLMVFVPGHVQHSHFATVDVAATFFVALALLLSTRALANPERQRQALFLAALIAGLAAATKYNAALVLIAPLVAWFFLSREKRESVSTGAALFPLVAVGFLIGCPYAVLDFPTFWGDGQNAGVAYELLVHPRQGHGDVFVNTGNGWWYHLFFNAPFLLTTPVLLLALIGLASTLRLQGTARAAALVLLLWCAFYFLPLGTSQVRFMRYLLPLVPALCVFAALGVLALRPLGNVAVRAAGVLAVVVTAWGAKDVFYPFAVQDARDRAARALAQNASTPASVGMAEPPWFWSPPLSPVDSPPFRRVPPKQLYEFSGQRYRFHFTGFDAARLQAEQPEYFVLSAFEWREKARLGDPQFQEFMSTLEREYSLMEKFQNTAPLPLPGRGFVPHDYLYTSPQIHLYRRRS